MTTATLSLPRLRIFRGVIAAASLKRRDAATPTHRASRIFRGVIAAASLKPVTDREAFLALSDLPRRNRRGLIEAGTARKAEPRRAWHLPRRNRRGLIEASTDDQQPPEMK